ncbi:MAG: CBS domain-containing protein [Actinomycetota bacterium]|nr:CBS domain-containing protein [Actinomycetota bacterium]
MRISDIMTQAAVTEQQDDSLASAARRMWEEQTGSMLVLDGEDLVGIVTERDILRAVATGVDLSQTRVGEAMTKDLVTATPGTSLREAARIMTERWIRHLPILDGGRLVGIVSQRDLSGVLAGALNEPEHLHRLIESSELVRERRLKRIEQGDYD